MEPPRSPLHRAAAALAGAAVAGALLAACAGASSGPGTATAPSTSPTTGPATTTTTAPSAIGELAPYFAAARATDRKLAAAADAVNGAVGTDQLTITDGVRAAIEAANPAAAAEAIPAGLGPQLLLPVLVVQNDLVSRYYALRGYEVPFTGTTGTATVPRSDPNAGYALSCLGNGSRAATSFAGDLAAAVAAAAAAPPVAVATPESQAAGDLAIWLQDLALRNSGCGTCGGNQLTSLAPITWHQIGPQFPGDLDWNGDIGGLRFRATYAAGQGWTVVLNAC